MFSSWFHKNNAHTGMIFDIGNGSIGGAFVLCEPNKPPSIIYSYREELPFSHRVDADRLMYLMTKHLRSVATNLAKETKTLSKETGVPYPRKAMCLFSSPWFVSKTKTVTLKKDKPSALTEHLLKEMIKKEEDEFATLLSARKHPAPLSKDMAVIEHVVVDTKINGYSTHNPFGKPASVIEVTFFTSLAPQEVVSKTRDIVEHSCHIRGVSFHSFALSSFSVLRDMFHDEHDFLSMDITGEVSDVSIVRHGVIKETISFPYGRATLLRRISKAMDISPDLALSELSLYFDDASHSHSRKKFETVIASIYDEWCALFNKAFLNSSRGISVPRKVFVTVDEDVASFFYACLSQQKCIIFPDEGRSSDQDRFDVTIIDDSNISSFVTHAPKVKQDPFLSIETMFMSRIHSGAPVIP